MTLISFIKDKWWVFVLVFIFLFSYYIRALNIVPDRLLSFDPIFQYRFTRYLVDHGTMPVWDELSYYVGRKLEPLPIMYYATYIVYLLINGFMSLSLMTVCSYMSAIYGALIIIPAFLLGRELSNKYGGLFSAILMGTAPQILVRTFGSSYDTDQLTVFFLILTLYLGVHVIRKWSIANFSLAVIGFTGFMLLWSYFLYPFFILSLSVVIYFILEMFISEGKLKINIVKGLKNSLTKSKNKFLILILIFISISLIGFINNLNIITDISILLGFAQKAEQWIVNVSIAELQPFNIFSLEGWITSTGRFVTGDTLIDSLILVFFLFVITLGILKRFKKDSYKTAFLITLLIMAIYTTFRGVRFTEFTSSLFILLIGIGFGSLLESTNDNMKKAVLLGLAIFIALIAMNISISTGKQLGPDIIPNWDDAWNFLKTKTPEFSIVGTWWDPGHMINGLAERRNFADGAHCELGFDGNPACMYTINDRITDLGKIMVTSDENESLNLIRKYQGDSPKVYWIASDDLIGKFQWLQYFGIGCDARVDQRCPLYIEIPEQSRTLDNNGNIVLRNYSNVLLYQASDISIPFYVQGINGAIFDEVIYYSSGNVTSIKFNETEKNVLIEALKPLEKQLNFRFTNQSIPLTAWMPQDYSYIVLIPPNLRDSVFTKMFMLEGQGLDHFKQVFRNEQVKIYEVV